ncbi:MAG: amidohydrolase [Rikenellaceae bacterium]
MSNILIKNILILPMSQAEDSPRYFEGSIGVSGSKIEFVSADATLVQAFERKYSSEGLTIIDGKGKLAMPGLVNTHNHVAMTIMRSYADDMVLNEWLEKKIFPFEDMLTRDDIFQGARFGMAEMLLGGTTAFVDMYWNNDALADAALETGMRAVAGCSLVDASVAKFEREIEMMVSKYRGVSDTLSIYAAPHAPYTCGPDAIKRVVAICDKYSLGVHTHINETQWELDVIKKNYGVDPVSYYDNLGLFDRPTIAAHAVYVDDRDIELFVRKGINIAHNPQSNMKMSAGIAPVAKMLDAGVNVALGTDGTCSNNDLDMWDEMRTAAFLQKVSTGDPCAMNAYQTLEMATVRGARAIGRGDDLGRLEVGFQADIVLVDIEKPHYYPRNDMASLLVYCGKASDVDTVLVAGEVVVRGGELSSGDVMDYASGVDDIASRIKKQLA